MAKVYSAINAVMRQVSKEGLAKGRTNAQQGYKFRGIDDVYNMLCGIMADVGLVILPYVQHVTREERTTKSGGTINYTMLTVDFTLVAVEDDSTCLVRTIGEAMDSADKSANKAQSAALKYAALQVFMIPTEGDNDADAHTPEPTVKDWPDSVKTMLQGIADAPDALKLRAWLKMNKPAIDTLDEAAAGYVAEAYNARKAAFTPAEQKEAA